MAWGNTQPTTQVFSFILSEEQSLNKNGFLRFSVLTGYREGVKPVSSGSNFTGFTDTVSHTRRLYMFNLSIVDMLTHGFEDPNHVILEVKKVPTKNHSSVKKQKKIEFELKDEEYDSIKKFNQKKNPIP